MAGAAAALGFAAPAQAGNYRVWTCRLPNGRPAPIHDATSGWFASLRAGTQFMITEDRCATGGGIYAALQGSQPLGHGGMWTFTPPEGTSLGAFAVTWSGTISGGGEATIARSDQPDPTYPERNGSSFPSHTVAQGGLDITSLTALAACSFAAGGCGDTPVVFSISRAVLGLNDFSAPQATEVAGDLASAPTLRGPMSVSFAGTDKGGGMYRVILQVDGQDQAAAPVPDPAGRCAPVDSTDVHSFQWPQPCPLDERVTVTMDAAQLPEGVHTIALQLEDAAGNRSVIAGPATRTVVHRGAFNGGDGAVLKRVGRYTVTTSFARRTPTLHGTLTRDGAPVPNALLDVLAQNRVANGHFQKIAEVRTDAQGNYSVRAPAGPSRLLRVAYKAYLADPEYASFVDVSHRVRARVELQRRTAHVSLRGTARFSGRVRGGFVPRRGKLIELQAFDHGRWRTFSTVRTKSSGRFTARYSFKRVPAPRSYRFRARARAESGYPFLLGVSRSVRIRVG